MYGAPDVFQNEHYPDAEYALRVVRQIQELYDAGLPVGERWINVFESGIDGGVIGWGKPPFPGTPRRGWQQWANWVYQTPQGNRIMDETFYWERLSAYDDALCAIPEIRWVFPFIAHPRPDWVDFTITQYILNKMAEKANAAPPITNLEQMIGDAAQAHLLRHNPAAALEAAAKGKGLFKGGSNEFDVMIGSTTYRVQVFEKPPDDTTQHIGYCILGDWGNLHWFTRKH
jgi:hypothetical protein